MVSNHLKAIRHEGVQPTMVSLKETCPLQSPGDLIPLQIIGALIPRQWDEGSPEDDQMLLRMLDVKNERSVSVFRILPYGMRSTDRSRNRGTCLLYMAPGKLPRGLFIDVDDDPEFLRVLRASTEHSTASLDKSKNMRMQLT
ncbi:hypothetical protein SLS62_010007 [Diatrype stigma]|uniref:Uncharacterized protein n=1 Tax=Diatrype stigma TaxID=117547 RepID=A0AAN9UAN6_9PEZI